jgi:ornithine cyclodeaminase/alanine dehydrogenase-like protein (mu-crystallin family)
MSASLPWIDGARVHAALGWPVLVDALREAFVAGAQVPLRHVHAIRPGEHARLLLMPAWREASDTQRAALGVKLVTVYPANRARGAATVGSLYILLDGVTGHPRALVDGEAITLRRTGAASALASQYLSREDSRVLAVIGPGRLAPYMVRAHRSVRPIDRVVVWGRDPARAGALAEALRAEGMDASAEPDIARAVGQADIVTCATTSREPLVRAAHVRPGTHVDLVGGYAPDMREADDTLVAQAAMYVDTRSGALAEAGDLVQPMRAGMFSRDQVKADLHQLCRGERRGRSSREAVTVFKSVGSALEDLCAAQVAWAAWAGGIGPAIPSQGSGGNS